MKTYVVANTIMGERPEPFLPFCLESICDAVDYLVLNDNSGNPNNPNLEALKASRMWKEGRVKLLQSRLADLGGFHGARNMCIDETANLGLNGDIWLLYLDCDEVHPESLSILTHKILPVLPKNIGVVEGYFFQFIQSLKYYGSIDHRHNLFFRYNSKVRWIEPIHSKLVNLEGKRLVTPYIYFHYGYVYSPDNLYRRFQLYHEYGALPDLASDGGVLAEGLKKLIPLTMLLKGKHPKAMRPYLQDLEKEMSGYISNFETALESYRAEYLKFPGVAALKLFLRELNFYIKLSLRDLAGACLLFSYLHNGFLMKQLWNETLPRRPLKSSASH